MSISNIAATSFTNVNPKLLVVKADATVSRLSKKLGQEVVPINKTHTKERRVYEATVKDIGRGAALDVMA